MKLRIGGAIRHFFSRILELITDWYIEDSGMYIDIEKLKRDRLGPDTHIVTTPIEKSILRSNKIGIEMVERFVPFVKHPEAIMVKGTAGVEQYGFSACSAPEREYDILLPVPIKLCGACGKKAEKDHMFCMECGTVLELKK